MHVLLQFLSHCKHGVRIVNVARGGLLEYEAVKEGLQSGMVGGMGLDVQWQVCKTGSIPSPATDRKDRRQTQVRVCNRSRMILKTSLPSTRRWC